MPLTVELDERIWNKSQVKRLKDLLEPGPFQFFKMEEDLQIAETERDSFASKLKSDEEDREDLKEVTADRDEAYFRLNEIAERLKEKKAALILEVLQDPKPRSTKKKKSLDEQRWSDSPPWSK